MGEMLVSQNILVGMDAETSSRAGAKPMDMEKQSLVVIDKGKKSLDRTSRDVVEKVWN